MGLDSLDTLEGDGGARESGSEALSDAERSRISQTIAGIKRTQKDETKARKNDDLLAILLGHMFRDASSHPLLLAMVPLVESNVPSHFIIGGVSLAYPEAARLVVTHYSSIEREGRERMRNIRTIAPVTSGDAIDFDERTLAPEIRERINLWIEDMFLSLTVDPSFLATKKLSEELAAPDTHPKITTFLAFVIRVFLASQRIRMSERTAIAYADFIAHELRVRTETMLKDRGFVF